MKKSVNLKQYIEVNKNVARALDLADRKAAENEELLELITEKDIESDT